MNFLSFDPSGNFLEGKGTTGWAMYSDGKLISVGQIRAEGSTSQSEYWEKHIDLIKALNPQEVVIEGFNLFASKKDAQVGSEFETSQLIGILKYHCSIKNILVVIQTPGIKKRYSNELLLEKGIVQRNRNGQYFAAGVPISRHILDAIRHGEFYKNFNRKKKVG